MFILVSVTKRTLCIPFPNALRQAYRKSIDLVPKYLNVYREKVAFGH
jgi:hypothetical protein